MYAFQSNAFQPTAFQAEIAIPAFQGGAFQLDAFQTTEKALEEWTHPLWISTEIRHRNRRNRQDEELMIILAMMEM